MTTAGRSTFPLSSLKIANQSRGEKKTGGDEGAERFQRNCRVFLTKTAKGQFVLKPGSGSV
jgi:hypothetical protein